MWGVTTLVMSVVILTIFANGPDFLTEASSFQRRRLQMIFPLCCKQGGLRRELFVTIFLQILWMILMGQHRANNLVLNQTYQRNLIIIFCLKQLDYLKIFQCIQIMRWFLWVFWPPFGIKLKIPNMCQIAHNQYWFLFKVWYPSRTLVVS